MSAFRRRIRFAWIFGACLAAGVARSAQAQAQPAPAPEIVSLQTRDGVQLKVTYYPSKVGQGTPQAKQVAPVVLLHDFKETRAVFAPLARLLQGAPEGEPQRPSFAVVTVDLRAHGDSIKQLRLDGSSVDLDAAKVGRNDLLAMATLDMEAVRGLLVVKNDAGELNLNKLCLLGAGMGASVAANWAAQDWAAPALAVGKQGQDVKALVLASPRWLNKGLSFQAPMRFQPLKQYAAWMLLYGEEDPRVKADVLRIAKQLEPFHPKLDDAANSPRENLAVVGLPSKLQGSTLITRGGPQVENQIIRFLVENVAQKDAPWLTRLDLVP